MKPAFSNWSTDKTQFSDLRLQATNRLNNRTSLTSISHHKKQSRYGTTNSYWIPNAAHGKALVAHHGKSATVGQQQSDLRRCQSASSVRKKLSQAVERSTTTNDARMSALLQERNKIQDLSLSASACPAQSSRPTPKTLLNRQNTHGGSLMQRKPSQERFLLAKANTKYTVETHKEHIRHNASELDRMLSDDLKTSYALNSQHRSTKKLEACRRAFDAVIEQDEHYAHVLGKVRDIFYAHFDAPRSVIDSENSQSGSTNQLSAQKDLEAECSRLQEENENLKKHCQKLEQDLRGLQLFTEEPSVEKSDSCGHLMEEDGLADVHLIAPSEMDQNVRPSQSHGIPVLNFANLSPYVDTDDEGDVQELQVSPWN